MTKRTWLIGTLLVFAAAFAPAIAQEAREKNEGKAADGGPERIVVAPEGLKDFSVSGRSTHFRLTVTTPSGGKINEPVVMGNVRHVRTSEITELDMSGHPTIGALRHEFVFRGTGAGKVKITIKKMSPSSPMP